MEKYERSPRSHSHGACIMLQPPEGHTMRKQNLVGYLSHSTESPFPMPWMQSALVCGLGTGRLLPYEDYCQPDVSNCPLSEWELCLPSHYAHLLTMLPSFWLVETVSKPQPKRAFLSNMFLQFFLTPALFFFYGSIFQCRSGEISINHKKSKDFLVTLFFPMEERGKTARRKSSKCVLFFVKTVIVLSTCSMFVYFSGSQSVRKDELDHSISSGMNFQACMRRVTKESCGKNYHRQ